MDWVRRGLVLMISTLVIVSCKVQSQTTGADTAEPSPITSPALIPSPSPTISPTKTSTPLSSPTPISSPTPDLHACLEQGGKLEIGSLASPHLPDPLEFRVYLPPCYTRELNRSYPVVYYIHGSTYTDDQWDRLGADEAADRLIQTGQAPPFLIVMPRDRVWTNPEHDKFGQAVVEDLIPWIDSHYRTYPYRSFRSVGGLSRGGAWAIHLGLSHWELFGAISAHSTVTFLTDVVSVRAKLEEIPARRLPRIYLDDGERDRYLDQAIWFEELLTELGVPHEWHLNPGYHEEKYWQAHVEEYLLWFTEDWLEKPGCNDCDK